MGLNLERGCEYQATNQLIFFALNKNNLEYKSLSVNTHHFQTMWRSYVKHCKEMENYLSTLSLWLSFIALKDKSKWQISVFLSCILKQQDDQKLWFKGFFFSYQKIEMGQALRRFYSTDSSKYKCRELVSSKVAH